MSEGTGVIRQRFELEGKINMEDGLKRSALDGRSMIKRLML